MASQILKLNVGMSWSKPGFRMIFRALTRRNAIWVLLLSATCLLTPHTALGVFRSNLQGQNFGTTNWSGGPILGWKELDYVPLRTVHSGGPATNQVMVITFDHTKGTSKGFEDLVGFTPSTNVIITSPPVLSAPAGSDIWSYTFTITVINAADGYVYFLGRLSAGSHGFAGASLSIKVNGTGQLQIKQPPAVLGNPDMALTKTGPSQAKAGQIITYVINYTNKLIAADTALGVQVTDILPAEVTYVPGSAGKNSTFSGNTITWNLGNLNPGKRGILTYKVMVTTNIPVTTTFANLAQILCSQDDVTPADNLASVSTTVVVTPTPVAVDDFYTIGKNMTLTISAPGVLANDTNGLSAVLLTAPLNGTLTFNTNGSFVYTPDPGFLGSDIFAYQALNSTNISGPAIVTIDVTNTCFLASAGNIVTNNDPGQCGAIVNFGPPTTTGDCAPIVCIPASGSFFPVGSTSVTCTNTDGFSASFLVTVLDTEVPSIVCPGNLVLAMDPGQCSRSNVTYAVTRSDNCPGVITLAQIAGLPSGSTFPVGTTTNTFTATDTSGNSNTCSFTVTINDTQPPSITCPANIVVDAPTGQCTSNVTFTVTANDACGIVTNLVSVPPSGSVFPLGVTVVTNIASDNSGNTSTCTFTVRVRDAQPPAITCPADVTVDANPGTCFATGVVLLAPTASDICGAITITSNAPAQFPVGTNVVTWTAIDSSSNAATCQQLVIVRDVQVPTITCPADVTVTANIGSCFATGVVLGSPTANDNCGAVLISSNAPVQFTVGTNVVTWTATDGSGNVSTCQQRVIVRDTEAPTINCPSSLVLEADPGQCSRSNVTFVVTATDNCGGVTVVSIPPSGSTFPIGTTIVTNIATDASGNQATCTFTVNTFAVTINDTEPPVITCPTNLVLTADPGQCGRSNVTFLVTASDNCTVTNLVSLPASGSTFPVGVTIVTNVATDVGGNQASCTFTVTVNDTEVPAIICPANLILTADAGQCSRSNVSFNVTATDNCTVTNLVSSPASGNTFPIGVTMVTNTATDSSGNVSRCTFTVTVNDTQLPIITCPADMIVAANIGSCFATGVVLGSPTATDNCGVASVTNNAPAQFPVGTNVVTWTAMDASGNTALCQQRVVVRDTEAPTINCPSSLLLEADPGQCSRSNVIFVVTASDNCPGVTVVSIPPSGSTFPLGTTVVTNIATDASGNQTMCTFDVNTFAVTVNDTEPPVITCPTNMVLNADPGRCSRSNVTFVVTATDNCTVTNLVSVPTNGSTFPVGVTIVTNIATDIGGNQASCTFTVTVNDTQNPSITCPTDLTVSANVGACFATGVILGSPTASDNCGSVTISSNVPAQFGFGTNLVTWTATDSSGNTATCQQRVIVTDNQQPTITCPTDVTVNANAGVCFATGVVLGSPTASDNCGTVTVTSNAPAQFAVGTNLVTWTATDSSGNTATCQQRVIVTDNQQPTITCPTDVTVNGNAGVCFATGVVLGSPTASDNCGAVTISSNAPAQFAFGTNLVTWTATDSSGNTATCQQRVIVTDNQQPTITCPTDVTVNANAGACFAIGVVLGSPTASDNCGTVTVTSNAPTQFPVGTNLVTWTATDSSGNSAICQQRVIVTDNQQPTITCPTDVTVNANAGVCFATGVVLGSPTASDNCGTVAVTSNAPAQFSFGTNLVTWTATDSSGNTATCQQRVIVTDNQQPTITCPTDVTVNANAGVCFATGVVLGSPTASDNCGTVTVTSNAPAQFGFGTNLVTWTATDSSGNTATCQQRVIVTDNQQPTITCPSDVTVNANVGACFATGVVLGSPTASDNCGAVTITSNAPAQFAAGTNLVTWTATDSSGNTATCQQRVIVTDNQQPTITCPADVTVNANVGVCFATGVGLGSPTASDNCGAVTISSNAPAQFAIGTNLVTWTVTDSSGNTATCQQRVIVTDNQPPTITTCPADVTVNANVGACFATGVVLGSPTANDNCGTVTISSNAPAQFAIGTNLVTWTVTDNSGNSTTCQQRVIVRDNQSPVITCPGNIVVDAAVGLCASNVTFVVTANDGCGSITNLVSLPASGSAFPVGITTVTSSATDDSGNVSQCTFTVTVRDIQPPTIFCPENVSATTPAGDTSININFTVTASDLCGTVTNLVSIPASGSAFPLGLTTVNSTATDNSGNSSQCSFTVTVTAGNRAPVANDDTYVLGKNTSLNASAPGVLGNDTDADGNTLTATLVNGPLFGTLTLNPSGGFIYTPASNYFGADSFTYRAHDAATNSGIATVTLTITNINRAPFAADDSYTLGKNSSLNIAAPGVLGNDSDLDGDAVTSAVVTTAAHGSLTLNANGSFIYTPISNYFGSDSFTYRASDGVANSGIATVTLTITNINRAPVASDDTYVLGKNVPLTLPAPGVLVNDTDLDGDSLMAIIAVGPLHGAVNLMPNGSFTYVPVSNYFGTDSFTYRANDGVVNSGLATVSLTITNLNRAPIATDDNYILAKNASITVAAPGVLSNDSDLDDDSLTAAVVSTVAHGSLTLNPDGSFTYTPASNYFGADSFTYRANDGVANSGLATVSLTITNLNRAPVASDDGYTLAKNGSITVTAPGVLGNDLDLDGDSLTATVATTVAHGSLTLNPDGSFTYTPASNYFGADSFTYRANDGVVNSGLATVSLTITNLNRAPVAADDSYTMAKNGSLTVTAPGVLGNDTDLDGDSLTAAVVAAAAHGSLTLNANGSFTYTPASNYFGADSFTYRANDGVANSGIATVSLTITNLNRAPVAADDNYTMAKNGSLTLTAPGVLGNDTDLDGDGLTALLSTAPSHGVLNLLPNGSFTYVPASNYFGADSFSYRANDGAVDSATATVSLTITNLNRAPVAAPESYTLGKNGSLNVAASGVLGNDTDLDGDALTAAVTTTVAHGSLTLNANGSFIYTPSSNYFGADSFTYQANDGVANSGIATVSLTITNINRAPVATDDTYSIAKNGVLTVNAPGVLSNDTDLDGDALTAAVVTTVAHGSLTLNANGSFTYTPASNYFGADTFTYRANDGLVNSGLATVSLTITELNRAPVAADDSYTLGKNSTLTVTTPGVLANDTDLDGNTLSAAVVATATHGSLSLNANGTFTYSPASNYFGADSFTYRANDGVVDSGIATVSLTITNINRAPVTAEDNYTLGKNSSLTVAATGVLTNDIDLDGDALIATVVVTVAHGSLTLNTNGGFTYTPASNYFGADSFTYQANDGAVDSAITTVTLTITNINRAPVATDDLYTMGKNGVLTVNVPGVLSNDTDLDGDSLTAAVVTTVAHGSLALNANGNFTYTPASNYFGADSFTYRANDGVVDSAIATVTLTITNVNRAPVATDDAYALGKNGSLTVPVPGVLSNDTDLDGDTLSAAMITTAAHGSLTVNANGSFTYTPASNYFGADSFTYRANDGLVDSAITTVSLTITNINRAPVANDDSYALGKNGSLTIVAPGVLGNDTDLDGDALSLSEVTITAHGSLTLNLDGSFTYTPSSNYFGADAFTYRLNDGTANSGVATVTLTITNVNRAPVATDDSYTLGKNSSLALPVPGVLGNDMDLDGDALGAALVTNAAHGTLTLDANGSFTYTPASNYFGADSFTYRANDGVVDSAIATVTLTITNVNRAPVATDDNYSLSKNGSLTVNAPGVLVNDTDLDGDALTAAVVSSPAHGNVILNSNGSFSYIPTSNYFGADSFTYQANDGLINSSSATVNLVITNAGFTGPQFGILQGPNVFNPQTGLFEQNVTVTNIGDTTAPAVRVLVDGLRSSVSLYNASGTNAGRPYVQHNSPLDPSQTVQLVLEFFVGDRRPFTNTLEAQSVLPAYNGIDGATGVAISRSFIDSRLAGNQRFVLEFATIPGRTYTIIYSDDQMVSWHAATPSITANATRTQWYDDGPPKTSRVPLSNVSRLYRVIVAPANP